MSAPERRTAPVLKVRCKSETVEDFVARYAADFSHDGVFVKTRSPFAIDTSLRFEFQLKDGSTVLGGRGRVSWTRDADDGPTRAAGMGIAFGEMADQARIVLDRLVLARGERPSRFEHRPRTQPPPPPGVPHSSPTGIDVLPAASHEHTTPLDPALLDLELSPRAPDPEPAPTLGLLGSALALSGDAAPEVQFAPPRSPTPPTPFAPTAPDASSHTAMASATSPHEASKVPSGLFSALMSKPFQIELRRSTPLPLAIRLKASSSAPPAPAAPSGSFARLAPPPPRLPRLTIDEDDETTLELSEEAYEPHPAPASLAPPKRGPLSAQVRAGDTMGQLTHLIEEAFHETARRSSRPAAPAEVLDLAALGGTPLQVEEQDIENLTGAELAGEIEHEQRRSSAAGPVRMEQLGKLLKGTERSGGAGVRAMTWILLLLLVCAAASAWGVRQLGPEALTPVMEPLVEFLQPVLEDAGWW